jgi:phage shock protein C
MATEKKLYRLPEEGMLAGVLAGLAKYFEIDVTLARIVFVIFSIATGGFGGVIVYAVLAVVMPKPGDVSAVHTETVDSIAKNAHEVVEEIKRKEQETNRGSNLLGWGIVVLGLWLLVGQLFPGWFVIRWDLVWPSIIIFLGLLIAFKAK